MTFSLKARRVAIRCAYVGLRVYWFVARPKVVGVKCVVKHDDDVLLVRHTYGRRSWDLPGGTVKRRELPIEATFVGRSVETADSEIVEVRLKEIDREERVMLVDRVD